MLSFGLWEIALVVTVALVFVGPERLPTMVRFLGRQYGKLMRASNELRRAFILEADRVDSEARSEHLKKLREEALERAQKLKEARSEDGDAQITSEENDEDKHGSPQAAVSRGEGEYSPFDFERLNAEKNDQESK
ncbi:MAG: twin-arginine translocase TatA/TatE family subunit [Myxococcota bacterium]|nr:twin-arginine translocase TatA/TatE family subunit [Myxococcota bacterium]